VTRREALVAAAAWAMAEYGPGECSARTVAAAADLPLAAVSYYFPRLDELLGLAAGRLVAGWLGHARAVADSRVGTGRAVAIETLTTALLPSADPVAVRSRYELVLAASRSESLAGPVAELQAGLTRTIADVLAGAELPDPPSPRTVRAAVDGAVLDALARGDADLPAGARGVLADLLA
jgi:DNA-binding transcriptional regulator YbjK